MKTYSYRWFWDQPRTVKELASILTYTPICRCVLRRKTFDVNDSICITLFDPVFNDPLFSTTLFHFLIFCQACSLLIIFWKRHFGNTSILRLFSWLWQLTSCCENSLFFLIWCFYPFHFCWARCFRFVFISKPWLAQSCLTFSTQRWNMGRTREGIALHSV